MISTGNPLDLMIEGDGFFQVRLPDGSIEYTRDGAFKMDADRNVVTAMGYRLEPALQIPLDATEVCVARDGTVSVVLATATPRSRTSASWNWRGFPMRRAWPPAAATCSCRRRAAASRCCDARAGRHR